MNLETLSHIAGVLGLLSIVITSFLAYRKNLLNTGFRNFQDMYRIEMVDFKKTVRDYIANNDKKNSRNIERIVELYGDTRNLIAEQNKICDIVQASKRIITKQEKDWKVRIEKDMNDLIKKVNHINKIVDNK